MQKRAFALVAALMMVSACGSRDESAATPDADPVPADDAAIPAGPDAAAREVLERTGRFDVDTNSHTLFVQKRLTTADQKVDFMQSFSFDGADVYVASVAPPSNEWVRITRLDAEGDIVSFMMLRNFGHAATTGLERFEGEVYIWIESAGGTRISRVRYLAGATFESGVPPVEDRTPPDAVGKKPRPVIDWSTDRLVVRYTSGTQLVFLGYPMEAARAGDFSAPIFEVSVSNPAGSQFQSSTVYGSYAYIYEGSAYGRPGTEAGPTNTCDPTTTTPGNACFTVFDLLTAEQVERDKTEMYKELSYREPEGIAVRVVDEVPTLVFGFVSPVSFPHTASLAYKSVWLEP